MAGGFPSLSLSFVFFRFLLCFFLSLGLLPLLPLFSLLFSSPSLGLFSSSSFSFSAALPCIYRKIGEGERVGAATVGRPLHYLQWITTPGKWVNCGRLIEPKPGKKVGEKRKKNDSSSLFSARPGEEDDGAVSKRHRFVFFFYNIFFEFYYFYYFLCGDPKMGYNKLLESV